MVLWLSSVKVDGHKKYTVPEVNFMPVGIGGAVSDETWMRYNVFQQLEHN
jgi:hypothetical protein